MENKDAFLKASMLGVGITDLIENKNNLFRLNGEITALDTDALSLPALPHKILSGNGFYQQHFAEDRVMSSAQSFVQTEQYHQLKQLKLACIKESSGENSQIYQQYLTNFELMENYLNGEAKEYEPEVYYFGNVRDFGSTDCETIYVTQTVGDIARLGNQLFSRHQEYFIDLTGNPLIATIGGRGDATPLV